MMTTMAETPINFKTRESRGESGQIFRVLALTPSRRIVGSVEIGVPLEPGYTLEERVGKARQQEILTLAEQLARMIADAVENPATAER